jgi:uncharacterized protein YkwD
LKQLFKIFLFLTVFSIVFYSCSKDETTTLPYTQIEKDINVLVNQHRVSVGKNSLILNTIIYNEAKGHSNNMATGKVPYSHDGSNARFDTIRKYFGGSSYGENVAMGYTTAQLVVNAWLASTGHKQNIEGDFNYTAIGVATSSNGTNYFTQIFIKK